MNTLAITGNNKVIMGSCGLIFSREVNSNNTYEVVVYAFDLVEFLSLLETFDFCSQTSKSGMEYMSTRA